jgi:hypothetical protein
VASVVCVLLRTCWISIFGAGNKAAYLLWECWASMFGIGSRAACLLLTWRMGALSLMMGMLVCRVCWMGHVLLLA